MDLYACERYSQPPPRTLSSGFALGQIRDRRLYRIEFQSLRPIAARNGGRTSLRLPSHLCGPNLHAFASNLQTAEAGSRIAAPAADRAGLYAVADNLSATQARIRISSSALILNPAVAFTGVNRTEAQHIALLALPDRARLQGESLKQILRHANPSLRVGEGGGTESWWICEVKFV